MSTGQISLGIIIVYLVAMLVITICNGRKKKQKSAEGFFLANRGVSSVLLPLTMIAAMQSTFAFLGAPGMYYTHGIPYIVMVLSQVWVALMVVYFGNKIRILAKKKGYMSLGDYLQDRFNSKYLKVLASCISVLMTMVFLSMQYVGNARAMSIVSGNAISYKAAIIVSILFSLMYVLIGGAGGVVLLDAIQAIILMVGIVLAAWIAIAPVGGIKELFTGIINQAPEMLSRPGAQGLYTDKYWIMQFLVLPFGIWFCPHIWSKSLMAKDEDAIAKSAISIPVSQILIYGFATLFIGLAGHLLATPEQVGAADNILPVLMLLHSNWLVAALVMAAAIAAGQAPVSGCPVGGPEVAKQVAAIMGQEVEEGRRMAAFVKCGGDCEHSRQNYVYDGVEDCSIMAFIPGGGSKKCHHGCLGYGTCVKTCTFNAIHIENGVAVVDKEKCKACGKCVSVCPHHLIELVPYEQKVKVKCSNLDKGKATMNACDNGCIGCKKCEKNCPVQAITVTNNVAHIDYDKCTNCGLCRDNCPRHCIQ